MPAETYPVHKIGTKEVIYVPVSFESGEQGEFGLPTLPYRAKPVGFESVVTGTVAGTDDGTVNLKKGSTTIASLTVAKDSSIGSRDTDNSVTAKEYETDERLKLETSKSTAGGRLMVAITVEVLPSH